MILRLANRECRTSECPSETIGAVSRMQKNLEQSESGSIGDDLSSVQINMSATICNDRNYMITDMKSYRFMGR